MCFLNISLSFVQETLNVTQSQELGTRSLSFVQNLGFWTRNSSTRNCWVTSWISFWRRKSGHWHWGLHWGLHFARNQSTRRSTRNCSKRSFWFIRSAWTHVHHTHVHIPSKSAKSFFVFTVTSSSTECLNQKEGTKNWDSHSVTVANVIQSSIQILQQPPVSLSLLLWSLRCSCVLNFLNRQCYWWTKLQPHAVQWSPGTQASSEQWIWSSAKSQVLLCFLFLPNFLQKGLCSSKRTL